MVSFGEHDNNAYETAVNYGEQIATGSESYQGLINQNVFNENNVQGNLYGDTVDNNVFSLG